MDTSVIYGSIKITKKIFDSLERVQIPDTKIVQRYFDHILIVKKAANEDTLKCDNSNNNFMRIKSTNLVLFKDNSENMLMGANSVKMDKNHQSAQINNFGSNTLRQNRPPQEYRRRTFKAPEDDNILFDDVKLKLQEYCNNACSKRL